MTPFSPFSSFSHGEHLGHKQRIFLVRIMKSTKKPPPHLFSCFWGYLRNVWAFQVALVARTCLASAGDARNTGSSPGSGRSP